MNEISTTSTSTEVALLKEESFSRLKKIDANKTTNSISKFWNVYFNAKSKSHKVSVSELVGNGIKFEWQNPVNTFKLYQVFVLENALKAGDLFRLSVICPPEVELSRAVRSIAIDRVVGDSKRTVLTFGPLKANSVDEAVRFASELQLDGGLPAGSYRLTIVLDPAPRTVEFKRVALSVVIDDNAERLIYAREQREAFSVTDAFREQWRALSARREFLDVADFDSEGPELDQPEPERLAH